MDAFVDIHTPLLTDAVETLSRLTNVNTLLLSNNHNKDFLQSPLSPSLYLCTRARQGHLLQGAANHWLLAAIRNDGAHSRASKGTFARQQSHPHMMHRISLCTRVQYFVLTQTFPLRSKHSHLVQTPSNLGELNTQRYGAGAMAQIGSFWWYSCGICCGKTSTR